MQKSYLALMFSSLLGLLGIGFIPAWILLFSEDGGLESIGLWLLAYIMWIPGVFVSIAIFTFLAKVFGLIKPSNKIITISVVLINFLAVFSIFPGLKLYVEAKQSMVESRNKIEINVIQNNIIEYKDPRYSNCKNCTHAFQYAIELTNLTSKPVEEALSKINLVFLTDYNWINFLSITTATNYEKLTILPNSSVTVEGLAPFTPSRSEQTKNASDFPLMILVAIKYKDATFDTEYFLEPSDQTVSAALELWNNRN